MSQQPHNPNLYATDAERALAGAAIANVGDPLTAEITPGEFADPFARAVWEFCLPLLREGRQVDPLVLARATGRPLGEVGELAPLATFAASETARVVRAAASCRKLAAVASGIMAALGKPGADPQAIIAEARLGLAGAEDGGAVESPTLGEALPEAFEALEIRMRRPDDHGVSLGLASLDRAVGRLYPTNLVVIAARPGVGKSSLALQAATDAASHGVPALMISLEMSRQELIERVLSRRARIDLRRLVSGRLSDEDIGGLQSAGEGLSRFPLRIVDGASELSRICALVRKWHARDVLRHPQRQGLVVLDYLQLVRSERLKGESREQEIARVTRELKSIALNEIKVPIVALSQLNRAGDKERREPRLSDLRESGAIEQDANQVFFIHDPEDEERPHERIIVCAKNRNGPTGTVPVVWEGPFTSFVDYARDEGPAPNPFAD